jgi:cell wall-associated protease
MKYKLSIILILIFLCFSCQRKSVYLPIKKTTLLLQKIDSIDLKNWHFKDIEMDTVPGISLNRAYDSLLYKKKTEPVIVAILDNEVDLNHDEFKGKLWVNQNEVANNGIDDDGNGYIDDLNGWNYLGNLKGKNNLYVNFEHTRIVRKGKNYFDKVDTLNLSKNDSTAFLKYKVAKLKFERSYSFYLMEKENFVGLYDDFFEAKKTISDRINNEDFNTEELEKMRLDYDEKFKDACDLLIELKQYGVEDAYIIRQRDQSVKWFETFVNLDYNDREIQGDNPEDLMDIGYGNNKLSENIAVLDHGTPMAGIITGIFKSENIKILPLAISCYGDEHDKDITLAIRYAVDNGAKVINMSFYKEMSMRQDWVLDAIKYASDNDVLIVSIAGNDGLNLNKELKYPNDRLSDGSEVSDNFILVGASNYKVNKDFKLSYSSYGSIDVDLFAPGDNIYTTAPFNEYDAESNGTSSAGAITSGVAALIRSYYPDLTASQVKHILMDSGIEYTLEVSTPTEEDPDKTTPFNQLSKSGKVLNAYNALLMAERISKGKRKDK